LIQRTIDYHESDDKFLKQFEYELDLLAGAIIEGLEEDPKVLLSPIWRKMIARQAKLIKAYRSQVLNILCVDNLGKPLKVPCIADY
jgi:hypothetical protein